MPFAWVASTRRHSLLRWPLTQLVPQPQGAAGVGGGRGIRAAAGRGVEPGRCARGVLRCAGGGGQGCDALQVRAMGEGGAVVAGVKSSPRVGEVNLICCSLGMYHVTCG